ncbi:tetratricopeptide repeat protein [Chitinimonas arctica]|uniref:Tetratricopeptide repeat protein n=1 Tax=Chitinimonas arctica TaxID=2594795 RepID=A0A516SE38_9NEIS|nr:tetratricopeptide repeat protein [Chitinimonas arctica]QDQ26436.1 tetratricopeptide repeat protein [Chitinimonas arctica]
MTIRPSHRSSALLLIAGLLAGCATPPAANTENAAPTAPARAPAISEKPVESVVIREDAKYPKQELSRELLFGILLGDFAALHGDKALAADTWLELARRTRDPRAAKRAVEMGFVAGKAEHALMASKYWRELEPDSLPARQMELSVLARVGKLAETEAALANWMKDRPQDVPGILMQAHTLWSPQADKQAILALMKRLAARHPQLPEASLAIALAANRAGDGAAALAAADNAIRLKPDWEAAILYRAALTEANPAVTVQYLQTATQRLPKSREIQAALARALTDAKRYADSRRIYMGLAQTYPDEVEYLVGHALATMQLRNYAEAEAPLTRALELGVSKPAVLHYYLGMVSEEQGKLTAAREHYLQVSDNEQSVPAAVRLARIEAKLGNREAALATLERLPQITPSDQVARVQLEAQIWRELKDLGRARATLDAGIGKHADNADLLYDRSLVFDQLGDLQAAEKDLRQYLVLKPDSPIGLNALGYTLANRTQRFEEAESLLRKALNQEPDNPVIIDSMGWLQYRRGNLEEAAKWLNRAFTTLPDPEIAAHYGEVLWQAGKHKEARKIWAEGKKLDPAHEVLSETMQRLNGE